MEGFEADNDRDYTPFSQSDDDSLLTDGKWVRGREGGREDAWEDVWEGRRRACGAHLSR